MHDNLIKVVLYLKNIKCARKFTYTDYLKLIDAILKNKLIICFLCVKIYFFNCYYWQVSGKIAYGASFLFDSQENQQVTRNFYI